MNYPESKLILEEIKKANKIILNLHRSPDPDSFSSAFSLYHYLISLGKKVDVCVILKTELSSYLSNQSDSSLLKFVEYNNFKFNDYDLFISTDSASWQQIVNDDKVGIPQIPIIVIDHHPTNEKFGIINLIQSDASSCSEMIYKLFQDWNFEIDKKIANILLSGIIADTGGFAFSDNPETLKISADLISLGASKSDIYNNIFRTKSFETLKYWGECFKLIEFDRDNRFVWVATPYRLENKYKINDSNFSTMFLNIVDGSDFGVLMSEDEPKSIKMSFRSRNGIDVSAIAQEFGGGGHKAAAGAKIEGFEFDEAVKKVLSICRRYAKKSV